MQWNPINHGKTKSVGPHGSEFLIRIQDFVVLDAYLCVCLCVCVGGVGLVDGGCLCIIRVCVRWVQLYDIFTAFLVFNMLFEQKARVISDWADVRPGRSAIRVEKQIMNFGSYKIPVRYLSYELGFLRDWVRGLKLHVRSYFSKLGFWFLWRIITPKLQIQTLS